MFYPIYQQLKQRLENPTTPLTSPALLGKVFMFQNQYLQSVKDKTSYIVPATYIEMPKATNVLYTRKIATAKQANIKVHYVSHAPFKAHTNAIQDAAIAAHEQTLREIDKLVTEWNATKGDYLLSQQFVATNYNVLNFDGNNVYSIITYTADLYSFSLP